MAMVTHGNDIEIENANEGLNTAVNEVFANEALVCQILKTRFGTALPNVYSPVISTYSETSAVTGCSIYFIKVIIHRTFTA